MATNPDHLTPFHLHTNGPLLTAHERLRAHYLMAYAAALTPEQASQQVPLLLHIPNYLERGWHDLTRHLLQLHREL